jgi:hypothetical protein
VASDEVKVRRYRRRLMRATHEAVAEKEEFLERAKKTAERFQSGRGSKEEKLRLIREMTSAYSRAVEADRARRVALQEYITLKKKKTGKGRR